MDVEPLVGADLAFEYLVVDSVVEDLRAAAGQAAEAGVALEQLPLADMKKIESRITNDVFGVLSVEKSVRSRTSFGGTAPKNVRAQAKKWLNRLNKER